MPREGYEVVTITKEARDALNELKVKLNAKSISDAIIKLNKLVDSFFMILAPEYGEKIYLQEAERKTPIRIQISIRKELRGSALM
ncbi:MAG: hypothetical protein QW584_02860 [Thermofilaceae archaeon]